MTDKRERPIQLQECMAAHGAAFTYVTNLEAKISQLEQQILEIQGNAAIRFAEAEARTHAVEKELARYKEEPCPKNHNGHWFDAEGNCVYCAKYDEENNLRLPAKARQDSAAEGGRG